MPRRSLPLRPIAVLAALLTGASAEASPPVSGAPAAMTTGSAAPNPELDMPHVWRSGIAIGFDLGAGLGGSSGYPNDVNQIGDSRYYSASGFMLGTAGSFFVMGALADYLNFGFWFGSLRGTNHDWRATGSGGGFRVELFPLYGLVPSLKDLGIMTRVGIGSAHLETKLAGTYPEAEGVQSFLGVGVFHEWRVAKMLGGHLSLGPTLNYDAIFAPSIESHGLTLGGRLVFYGGP